MPHEIKITTVVPDTEYSKSFLAGMIDRMGMSFFKYGYTRVAFPSRVDAIKTLELKLEEYKIKGNTELLIDIANYAMIEFMYPKHQLAHYKPTDGSTGRMWNGETNPTERANDPSTWVKDND